MNDDQKGVSCGMIILFFLVLGAFASCVPKDDSWKRDAICYYSVEAATSSRDFKNGARWFVDEYNRSCIENID